MGSEVGSDLERLGEGFGVSNLNSGDSHVNDGDSPQKYVDSYVDKSSDSYIRNKNSVVIGSKLNLGGRDKSRLDTQQTNRDSQVSNVISNFSDVDSQLPNVDCQFPNMVNTDSFYSGVSTNTVGGSDHDVEIRDYMREVSTRTVRDSDHDVDIEVSTRRQRESDYNVTFGGNLRHNYLASTSRTSLDTQLETDEDNLETVETNQRLLSRVLGLVGLSDTSDSGGNKANITGYEVITGTGGQKYTVYKIHVSCPTSRPNTSWFVERRYSDFLQLRSNIMNKGAASRHPFPPKRLLGNNLDPTFLGGRLSGLQMFLTSVMKDPELSRGLPVTNFLCLERSQTLDGQAMNRVVCDTLEETVRELREQLRKREILEEDLDSIRDQGSEKDRRITFLEKENILLREQKESLTKALSSLVMDSSQTSIRTILLGMVMNVKNSSASPAISKINNESKTDRICTSVSKQKVETLEDFTTKFNLKPLAVSTPTKPSNRRNNISRRMSDFYETE